MVHLQKLHEMHAKNGLLVFAIAMHPDAKVAQQLTRELGLTYPIFEGMGSDLGRLYAYG
jgi:hypothetical protein